MANGRTVNLVTGANKGIGYEVARQLGAYGGTILVGARHRGRGEAATQRLLDAGVAAVHLPLDVTVPEEAAAAAAWIEDEYGRLDVLVNNAGVLLEQGEQPSDLTADLLRRTYETNVFGVVTVTNAMLPLLRRSPAGRIVNISSALGSLRLVSTPGTVHSQWPIVAYTSSKTALNMLTVKYANQLRDTPIKVNSACPGYVATDLNGNSGVSTPAEGAAIAVRLATLGADGPSGGFFDIDGPVDW